MSGEQEDKDDNNKKVKKKKKKKSVDIPVDLPDTAEPEVTEQTRDLVHQQNDHPEPAIDHPDANTTQDQIDENEISNVEQEAPIPAETVDSQDKPERKSKSRKSVKRKKRTKSKKPEIQPVIIDDNVDTSIMQTNVDNPNQEPQESIGNDKQDDDNKNVSDQPVADDLAHEKTEGEIWVKYLQDFYD